MTPKIICPLMSGKGAGLVACEQERCAFWLGEQEEPNRISYTCGLMAGVCALRDIAGTMETGETWLDEINTKLERKPT